MFQSSRGSCHTQRCSNRCWNSCSDHEFKKQVAETKMAINKAPHAIFNAISPARSFSTRYTPMLAPQ
jgi:excinuclease UvrABC nuclease subunit